MSKDHQNIQKQNSVELSKQASERASKRVIERTTERTNERTKSYKMEYSSQPKQKQQTPINFLFFLFCFALLLFFSYQIESKNSTKTNMYILADKLNDDDIFQVTERKKKRCLSASLPACLLIIITFSSFLFFGSDQQNKNKLFVLCASQQVRLKSELEELRFPSQTKPSRLTTT